MNADALDRERQLAGFLAAARPQLQRAKLHAAGEGRWREETIGERRRRGRRGPGDDGPQVLNLVEAEEGVLRWDLDGDYEPAVPGRRSRRGLGQLMGRLVEQFRFDPLRGSQVGSFLAGLDEDFNALRGLHAVGAAGAPLAPAKAPASGRVLVIVHGTFSKGAAIVDELRSTPAGTAFLDDARKAYKGHVLTFEHPTLSVSPILNALDLARAFAGSKADVDVVCHSRGGLVTRWWLEKVGGANGARVVFVGSPLSGTSLASPARLRQALDLLTNVSVVLHAASAAVGTALPVFGLVAGLVKMLASVGAVGAKTPVVDAAVAMIPGLAAQSRIRENFELVRLRDGLTAAPPEYSIVKAEFEPKDAGWAFWKYFTEFKGRAADLAADTLFPGANDLVVDSAAMNDFAEGVEVSAAARVLDFGKQDRVHHLNYFAQKETVAFLRKRLGV